MNSFSVEIYDGLTGLQNRAAFIMSFEQALARAHRDRHAAGCLIVNLDGFDALNVELGKEAGDQVLIVVAQILRDAVRVSDVVGRLRGDEFAVVLSWINKPAGAAIVAEKIRLAIDRPINVQGHQAHVTASIGISFYPEDATEAEELLEAAAEALAAAKKAGKNQIAVTEHHPGRKRTSS